MPRSRRRHHSRSRSRSRSHSHDRDRDAKRRKVESFDSMHNHGSVSSESEANENFAQNGNDCPLVKDIAPTASSPTKNASSSSSSSISSQSETEEVADKQTKTIDNDDADVSMKEECGKNAEQSNCDGDSPLKDISQGSDAEEISSTDLDTTGQQADVSVNSIPDLNKSTTSISLAKKALTPKQHKLQQEREKKRLERRQEKEERKQKRQAELDEKKKQKEAKEAEVRELKEKERESRRKEKEEKEEAKRKEKEEKDKEREAKRKEKEEKEEAKRKEKELERQRKQAELDEKLREKQKVEEKKQKTAQAFTKFFVTKQSITKSEKDEEETCKPIAANSVFMPFELKSDMRLAPNVRRTLTAEDLKLFDKTFVSQKAADTYLKEVRSKVLGKSGKTWPYEEDVLLVNEFGSRLVDEKAGERMHVKFLKFAENRRPPYYATWRKKSKFITGRRPFATDTGFFNYEVDSDEEWDEEEVEGENIAGSDEDEKDVESENDNDYEVDNEFLVPHGHLSDDEQGEDAENISPEMRKAQEKLLKHAFDEEHKQNMKRLKPKVIGVWFNNNEEPTDSAEQAIYKFLQPFSILANGCVKLVKRSDITIQAGSFQPEQEGLPHLLRLLHGNPTKRLGVLFGEFCAHVKAECLNAKWTRKKYFNKCIRYVAKYGPSGDKMKACWLVKSDILAKYKDLQLSLPNQWKYHTIV